MARQRTFSPFLVLTIIFFLAKHKSQVFGAALLPSFSDSEATTTRLNNDEENNDGSEFPQIFLENVPTGHRPDPFDPFDDDDGEFNSLISCKGTNLHKLRIIHCNDFPDCQIKLDCLKSRSSANNQTCPSTTATGGRNSNYVKIGSPCNNSTSVPPAPSSVNCLHLNLTTSFSNGLIECTGHHHDLSQGSMTRTTIDYFARGPSFIYKDTYLTGQSIFRGVEDRQLLTDYRMSAKLGIVIKKGGWIVHDFGTLYPNDLVFIYCHVNRIYFDPASIQIFHKKANGEKVAVDSVDIHLDRLDPVPFYDVMRTNLTISANDSGFICSAKFINSRHRGEAILNFKQGGPAPPLIDRSHDGGPNKTFHRGDTNKELACFARGDPQPSVSFYRDGRKIFPDGLQMRPSFRDEMRRTLRLASVDGTAIVDDSVAGIWTCRAENIYGIDNFNITVTVVE